MDPITFEYQYDDQDFAAFMSFSLQKLLKRVSPKLAVILTATAICLALWLAVNSYGFLAGLSVGTTLAAAIQLGTFKKMLRKAWSGNPVFHERSRATVSAEAISIQGSTFGIKRLWRSLQAYGEIDDYFVLYQSETPILWLPKRAFRDNVNQVRSIIASSLPVRP